MNNFKITKLKNEVKKLNSQYEKLGIRIMEDSIELLSLNDYVNHTAVCSDIDKYGRIG